MTVTAFSTPTALPTRRAQTLSRCLVRPSMTLAEPPNTTSSNNSKRLPTFKKLQRRHRNGPATFRQRKEAEQIQQMADIKAARAKPRSTSRPDAIPLSQLSVGQQLEAVAQNMMPYGVYMDVGAQRDGMVHVRDMSVDFVHAPRDVVKSGDRVTVWVKYVDPVKKVLGLTMIKPQMGFDNRTPVDNIIRGDTHHGVVERITNYGAYVDIGAERLAFLHVSNVWGHDQREELDYLRLGEKICVYILSVDTVKRHIRLSARDINGRRLTEHSKPQLERKPRVSAKMHLGESATLMATMRPGQMLEDDEAEEENEQFSVLLQGEGQVDDEAGEEDNDDEWADDEGFNFVDEEPVVSFEGIEHMLSQDTEFIDMEPFVNETK